MENFANSSKYKEYMKQFEYIFDEKYLKKKIDENIINQYYKISINEYNHTYNVAKNYAKSISCHEIRLLHNDKTIYTNKIVWTVQPFFQYIKHKNENEYFMCGSNLLFFSVYNITENTEYKYIDEYMANDDYDGDCNNEFWYITELIYNKNNNFIAINGQDGTNDPTVTICDFTEPEKLPYNCVNLSPIIYKEYGRRTCNSKKWLEDNSLLIVLDEKYSNEIIITENELKNMLKNNKWNGK
jgi:hypothetical protein